MTQNDNKYTQRQWDRTVGWGTVPDEYKRDEWKELYDEDDRNKSTENCMGFIQGQKKQL